MTNSYYTVTNGGGTVVGGTKARAAVINSHLAALEAAFDQLPATPATLHTGRAELGTESGSGNSYAVTMATTRTSNVDGDEIVFKATHANTGAATLQVDAVSAVALRRADGSALSSGDIQSGLWYVARYDATNTRFLIVAPTILTVAGAITYAAPSASVGLAATAGTASTLMRSDAAPALDVGIAPTWTGQHIFNNPLRGPDGAASAPGLAFKDDTDTGFYRTGTNAIGVSTGNALVAEFSSTGLNMQDKLVTRPEIKDYAETISEPTISSGTLTLNLENGNVFKVTNNANITTFSITNWPATGKLGSCTLILAANGTGYTQSWGSAVKWANSVTPTITTTNGKYDYITFISFDGGTTIHATRGLFNVG